MRPEKSIELRGYRLDQTSLTKNYGLKADICRKIFSFFSKQADRVNNRRELLSIMAGIITFAPDRRYSFSQYSDQSRVYSKSRDDTNTRIIAGGYYQKMSEIQDKCFELLDVYVERYNHFDKTLTREV